jgi:GGDEF domain-containing protein
MLDILAFWQRVARKPAMDRAEATGWEWRYAAGSGVMALILGLFAARSLVLEDAICSVMAIGIGFGFGAGVVARLSLRPAIAIMDLGVIGLPVIATSFIHQQDAPHIGLGLLMTIYVIGSFEMVRLGYKSTLSQMTLKQQFEQLSRTDPMTGLLNRSVLAIDFERIVAENRGGSIAVHAIDLIVRMGGDEFILVQKSIASREDAEATARSISESLSARYCVDGYDIEIGASIGIAMSPRDGRTVEALLARSDHALYRAKAKRGGFVFARDLASADPSVALAEEAAERQRVA